MTTSEIAEQLKISGLCVCPNYLPADTLRKTQTDFDQLLAAGAFHRAGVGRTNERSVQDSIRRDQIYWLEKSETTTSSQKALWVHFDQLMTTFNRELYLGLKEFEAHYANYPPGGFYSRHRDSFAQSPSRVVSLVLYLNSDWQASHGGQLRIYKDDTHFDIAPIAGTLVCFMSQDIEHEVLPSHSPRRSLAGWFRQSK